MYKLIIRPLFFLFDPEKIHHFTFTLIRILSKIPGFSFLISLLYEVKDKRLERELFGLKFKNPVGLAAGFDKDAKLYKELSSFGFGFIEIGTLTPKSQVGNPKKRLFRLQTDSAIINRMGFNNDGLETTFVKLKNPLVHINDDWLKNKQSKGFRIFENQLAMRYASYSGTIIRYKVAINEIELLEAEISKVLKKNKE